MIFSSSLHVVFFVSQKTESSSGDLNFRVFQVVRIHMEQQDGPDRHK